MPKMGEVAARTARRMTGNQTSIIMIRSCANGGEWERKIIPKNVDSMKNRVTLSEEIRSEIEGLLNQGNSLKPSRKDLREGTREFDTRLLDDIRKAETLRVINPTSWPRSISSRTPVRSQPSHLLCSGIPSGYFLKSMFPIKIRYHAPEI